MIRFIVFTTTSRRDSDGDCFHFSVFTSTKTYRERALYHGTKGPADAVDKLRSAGLTWEELYTCKRVVSKPDWVIEKSYWDERSLIKTDSEVTAQELLELEQEAETQKRAIQ